MSGWPSSDWLQGRMRDTITLELDRTDVAVLTVALADIRDPHGEPAWNHRNVRRLREKVAEAIESRG
jgi:hypothetical protein